MLSNFLIALREGLEASLIIGILVAFIVRSNNRKSLVLVWIGVALAALASLTFGAFLSFTSAQLSPRGEQIFAGTTSLAAVALVTWMVFWMKSNARGLRENIHGKVEEALPMGKIALVLTAFFAVVREGLETSLFLFTNAKTVHDNSRPLIGLILGLVAAIGLGVALYRRSIKINISKFFAITGTALLIVAAGVLQHAVFEFQEFGALPGAHALIWDWTGAPSAVTTILSGTIGINTTTSWLQFIVWVGYLGLVIRPYLAPAKAQPKREEVPA